MSIVPPRPSTLDLGRSEIERATADENFRLQHCIRDLAALTALPALWTNCDCSKIVDSLAEALSGMLALDFIYISIEGLLAMPSIKIGRHKDRALTLNEAEAIEKWYAAARTHAGATRGAFVDPWDGLETNVSVLPIRADGFDSLMIAGKRQAGFPAKTDNVLLRTGMNQATLHLKRIDAEVALRQQADEFDMVLSSITDFAFSYDVEGRVKFANKPLLDLWQLSLEQAKGKTFIELYPHSAAAANLHRQILQVAETKEVLMDELPYMQKSGSIGYYQYIFAPQFAANGSVHSIVGTGRDVTELKEAEARDRFLMELDSALRPLTDPAEITLAAATMLGRHLKVDRCAYADIDEDEDTMNLAGNYRRAPDVKSLVGRKKMSDFGDEVVQMMRANKPFVVNDIETHQPPVEKIEAYRASQMRALISVPLHKDGRFAAGMSVQQSKPRQWTQKEVELVTNVASRCWESIERSRIERELSKRYSSLFMQTPIAICVLEGPEHVFRLANPSYSALFGAEGRDLIGKPVFDALPEMRGQGFEQLLDQVYRSGEPYSGREAVVELRHKMGVKQRFIDFTYQPRFNAKGVVDGVLVVAADVTEKVGARLNLEAAIRELRATTNENTRLLDEMRQYADALKDTDRRKDEFLATLAHELRNPLAPIKNSLEILRHVDDKERIARLRDIMDAQLTHLIRLVDDLLDMSRINEGKIELRKERLTIQSVVQTAIEASRWQFEEQKHELAVDLPEEAIWVEADATRLTQVISNLMNNAGKYTGRGGKIRLSAARSETMATITVTDNGVGIPQDMMERIFEPFTQIECSKPHSRGGMGIGLSIVKRLVEMHGGYVTVASAGLNQGSSFTVNLPVAEKPAQMLPAASAGAAQPVEDSLRVLVVDDNVDSAQTIGWMLESKHHQPVLAHTGMEALALAFQQHPDVILLDLGLPDISGYEVCRELRKTDEFRNTLIVAQTGWGQKRDREMSKEAGFDQHLVKPIDMEDISRLLAGRFGSGGGLRGAPIA